MLSGWEERSAGRKASITSATVDEPVSVVADESHEALQQGLLVFAQYTLQQAENNDGSYFFIDPDLNRGTSDNDRRHLFAVSTVAEVPMGRGKAWLSDTRTS